MRGRPLVLYPTKHEDLRLNSLVVGAEILRILRDEQSWESVEGLFQRLTESTPISLDQYYNALLFLWLAGLIKKDGFFVARIAG